MHKAIDSKNEGQNAKIDLALMKLFGKGQETNIREGLILLEEAAKQEKIGYSRAMRALAAIYANERLGVKNYELSKYWLERANFNELDYIKKFSSNGYLSKAFESAILFSESNNTEAQWAVYGLYMAMQRPQWAKEQALYWLKESVKKGSYHGQLWLSWAYFKGIDVDKNLVKAHELSKSIMPEMKKKAHDGDLESQENLAVAYFYGLGVDKNLNLAKKWNEIAIKNGSTIRANELKEEFEKIGINYNDI